MKLTKQKLKQIIKEELEEAYGGALGPFPERYDTKKQRISGRTLEHDMYNTDDELREIGVNIADLTKLTERVTAHLSKIQARYGEMAHIGSYAATAQEAAQTLSNKYEDALDELSRSTEKGWYK